MRIVFLSPVGQIGGAERFLTDAWALLRAARPDWRLHLVSASDGPLVERATSLGVAAVVAPIPEALAALGDAGAGGHAGNGISRPDLLGRMVVASVHLPAYVRSLRRVLRSLAPDVVHSNGFKTHFLSAWTAPTGCPIIWHMHEYVRCRPVAARLTRMLSNSAALMLANSNAVAEDLRALCGSGANIKTVYAAVDTQRFSPSGPRLDLDSLCKLPQPERPCVRIGMVATMAKWKGHEIFLRAVARLPRGLPVRAYVIGGPLYSTNGSQRRIQDLKLVANDLGIGERVGFTGYVEDTASAMRALDVIVHASIEPEPFGLVIAEGMACGRAVVAAQNAGASELIRFGVHALDHPPGDDAELAERISRLVQSANLRRQLGFAARHAAVHSFSGSRLSAQLVETYAAVCPRSSRAAAA